MRNIVSELFTRFVAGFPHGEDAILRADQIQAGELATPAKPPVHTVMVKGRRDGREEALAMVAMTVPSLSPEDPALLELVVRRARAHKAPHFITWTLRDASLWKTPKPGTPTTRDCLEKLRHYPDLYQIAASDEQIADEQIKLKILGRGSTLLDDLGRLFRDEALELVQIEATYFVGRLLEAVHRLLPMVSASLLSRLDTDHAFRQEMGVWAVRQGIAGDPGDAEFAESIARQIIYRLLGKVLFYQSLRRSARQLPDLDLRGVDTARVLPTLREAFARALEIDYYAVFAEDLPDRVQWPADASRELASLIHDFHTRDFSNVPQDVIGTVFEQLIPPEERHGLGQYFTPENVCDLILGFCVQSVDAYVFDPTCGTGTFLIRGYDRLRWLGRQDHTALLCQIWGVDIAPFPAELATINLFRRRVAEHGNFPRIICQDFFGISPGQCFQFPPPKVDLEQPEMVQHQMPQFDAIVGNFPFIRQEKIEKLVPGYKRQIEQVIARGWFESYSDAFTFSSIRLRKEVDRLRKLKVPYGELLDQAELKLSGKADILAYLFFQAARFVKPGGRMGIITSNAWLDVDYGHELQRFLLDNFKITAILESRCEPWFTEADVNTIATIVERCDSAKDRADHLVKFAKVKRPLADLIPGDPRTAALDRWNTIRRLTERIERAGRKDRNTRPLGVITDEDDNFRARVCRQSELRADIEEKQRTAKWGALLRAPSVYFDVQKGEPTPEAVWRGVLSAFRQPMEGEAHRPARLQVPRAEFCRAWQSMLAEISVECVIQPDPEPVVQMVEGWVNESEANRLPSLDKDSDPREFPQTGETWQADFFHVPMVVSNEDVGVERPWMALVIDKQSYFLLSSEVIPGEPTPEQLWEILLRTMAHPGSREPMRPSLVELSDSDCYDFVTPKLSRCGVDCVLADELPELRELCQVLASGLAKERALAQGHGITEGQMESFYYEAARYFDAAPCKHAPEQIPIEIRCRGLRAGTMYVIVLGRIGVTLGLAFYRGWRNLLEMLQGRRSPEDMSGFSIIFDEESGMAPADLHLVERNGWPIATPEAYPAALRFEPGRKPRAPTSADLDYIEVCLRTIPDFVTCGRKAKTYELVTNGKHVKMRLAWKLACP